MLNSTAGLQEMLELRFPAIAIGFLNSPPAGMARWPGGPVPAGCVFWQKAMDGQIFYTTPEDHYNCAVGAYTHKIALPEGRAGELEQTIGFMVDSQYLDMSEVAGIPTLAQSPPYVAYSPLDQANFIPDVILVAAKPSQAMLLYEAAVKAGAGNALTNALGRPACAVLPLTTNSGATSLSLGCKGNRTFTGRPDDEMYVCIPGQKWQAVVGKLAETFQANQTMGNFYTDRKCLFPAG